MPSAPSEATPLIPWLAGKRPMRVAVLGDVILDEYIDGQVSRISPEAPVPVHLVTKTFHGAGGAGNAALNVKFAGGDALVFSVVGDDEAGRQLKALLTKEKVETSHVFAVSDRPTVRKTRITASSQHHIVRIDWEKVHPIDQATQDALVKGLSAAEFDALLISDYGKGTLPVTLLSRAIALAASRGVPVVVDPKGHDYSRYSGATLITPNRKEACEALGLDASGPEAGEDLAKRLQKTYALKNVLVTLGPKGMLLVTESGETASAAAIAREVFDVSGAGDTVVAVMTLCLAAKASLTQAIHVANTAAAIVVGKWGTQPVQLVELEAALRARPDPKQQSFATSGKITSKETLRRIVKGSETRSKKVVFTNGCFDLMHAGHVEYLEAARSLGDLLVVGVNTDESMRELKGPKRPIVALEHRARVLASLACVDYVVAFGEATPKDLIAFIVPDVLVKGADYDKDAGSGAKTYIVGEDTVRQAGGRVETIALVPGLSTTELIRRVRDS